MAELEAKLGVPPKTPDNSSVPPSKGHKPNRAKKAKRSGPRQGSLGRTGGGRALAANPDEVVTAKPVRCAHCQAVLGEADQTLHGRYDKIDLPNVAPVVTREMSRRKLKFSGRRWPITSYAAIAFCSRTGLPECCACSFASAERSTGSCLCAFNRRNPFAASSIAAPVQRRAIEASRQRFTLRQTRRMRPSCSQ